MKTISHKILLLISVAIMVVFIVLYGYMHYSIQASVGRAILGNQIVRIEEKNISQEQSLVDMYYSTVRNRKKMRTLFIPSDEAVSFIESLEQLGTYTGTKVSISSVSSDTASSVASSTFAKINAHVEVAGPWDAVMRTLRLAETLPYQVLLSNIRLSTSPGLDLNDKKGDKPTWRLLFDTASNMMVVGNTSSPVVIGPTLTSRVISMERKSPKSYENK